MLQSLFQTDVDADIQCVKMALVFQSISFVMELLNVTMGQMRTPDTAEVIMNLLY